MTVSSFRSHVNSSKNGKVQKHGTVSLNGIDLHDCLGASTGSEAKHIGQTGHKKHDDQDMFAQYTTLPRSLE